jgi:hypothetical protein
MSNSFEQIGVKFKGDNNPKLKSKYDDTKISFNKTRKDLEYLDDFVRFVRSVERLVRLHPDYTNYIGELKSKLDLRNCSFLSNITDEMVDIEMHHGPIFTLFDICYIVTNYYLKKFERVNSIVISEVVINEHYENNIQVVMLSTVAHQLAHVGKIYINPKQAWGNIDQFIKKYREGINKEYEENINKTLEIAHKYDSNDFGMFDLNEKPKNYK